MNGDDPFDELEIDDSILTPEDHGAFSTDAPPPPDASQHPTQSLPAHIKRSHLQEEDDWHYQILTSTEEMIYLKCGSRQAADLKRNKLYNARTYLKFSEALRLDDPLHRSELDNWTLLVQEYKDGWYVVAIDLKLDSWSTEKPEQL